jgi:hypothetical protein
MNPPSEIAIEMPDSLISTSIFVGPVYEARAAGAFAPARCGVQPKGDEWSNLTPSMIGRWPSFDASRFCKLQVLTKR